MNILFVDDEPEVLDGIINGIDFDSIGIDNVYMAANAIRAKELLSTVTIDILVTDIEMPDISGIELLEWVSDRKLPVVSLFCTAYADFAYAQKAIALHVFDYFLKPIFFEDLKKKIIAAVSEVTKRRQQIDYEKYSQVMKKYEQEFKNNFWREIFDHITQPDHTFLVRLEHKYGVGYAQEDYFSLVVVDLQKGFKREWDTFSVGDLAQELQINVFERFQIRPEAFLSKKRHAAVLLFYSGKTGLPVHFMQRLCHGMQQYCNKQCDLNCSFYYKENIRYPLVFKAYQKIETVFRHDVISNNRIYNMDEYNEKVSQYSNPSMKDWELLLANNKIEKLTSKVMDFYHKLVSEGILTYSGAKAFRTDILQLVYSVLQTKQLMAHELFENDNFEDKYIHACDSVTNMHEFIEYVFGVARDAINSYDHADSLIETVKKYISEHLGEDIKRENLTEIIYLNPDYLARLFKADVGKTMGAYIRDMRMERAKQLLRSSDETIGNIAWEVGYDNFSYFSQLFRKNTGMSPKEYRCQMQKKESDSGILPD
ncbi:MAG: helix-turn-helix domain-containing protein [Lachnospiraceae bacterium]|nr:helix-turn-helix domain-containing protein [Lachnospiraceae bacterium]MBD5456150.1 helix-turn-helix domain-containing protein [Lachnospiraceae bacterium]